MAPQPRLLTAQPSLRSPPMPLRAEVVADERHDAGDHGGVEAEQEAAQRNGQRDRDDVLSTLRHALKLPPAVMQQRPKMSR